MLDQGQIWPQYFLWSVGFAPLSQTSNSCKTKNCRYCSLLNSSGRERCKSTGRTYSCLKHIRPLKINGLFLILRARSFSANSGKNKGKKTKVHFLLFDHNNRSRIAECTYFCFFTPANCFITTQYLKESYALYAHCISCFFLFVLSSRARVQFRKILD